MPVGGTQTTLALRAARHFGWEDRPRIGIKVDGNYGYLMVADVNGHKVIGHYSERYAPTGNVITLTEQQQATLVDALLTKEAS